MIVHKTPSLTIYFGNAQDALFPDQYRALKDIDLPLISIAPFDGMRKLLHARSLIFLDQVHKADGHVITSDCEDWKSFTREGDYLISRLPHVGLGIMTADCLPIVCYDRQHHALGVAHAGWRGSVGEVGPAMLTHMQKEFGTHFDQVQIFFGPSIKPCCYQVRDDVREAFAQSPFADEIIQWHGESYYFDLPGLNRLMLEQMGVSKEAFHLDYNVCTACDEHFFSNRRQKERAGRQMTVACLS